MYNKLKSENIDDENYEREVGEDGLWRWGIVAEYHTKVTAPAAGGLSNSPGACPACVESWIADARAVVPARPSKLTYLG